MQFNISRIIHIFWLVIYYYCTYTHILYIQYCAPGHLLYDLLPHYFSFQRGFRGKFVARNSV